MTTTPKKSANNGFDFGPQPVTSKMRKQIDATRRSMEYIRENGGVAFRFPRKKKSRI